jgi:hypothetical protein
VTVAIAKTQSIRLGSEDVAILEEIQRRTGLFGLSEAMRYALRQYAQQAAIDVPKPKPKPKTRQK